MLERIGWIACLGLALALLLWANSCGDYYTLDYCPRDYDQRRCEVCHE